MAKQVPQLRCMWSRMDLAQFSDRNNSVHQPFLRRDAVVTHGSGAFALLSTFPLKSIRSYEHGNM